MVLSSQFGATHIGERAFDHCHNLTSVVIPNSVITIGKDAFIHCGRLKSVNIGGGVTSIDDDAFWQCDSLKSVTIGCSNLTLVMIGSMATSIANNAFDNGDRVRVVYSASVTNNSTAAAA